MDMRYREATREDFEGESRINPNRSWAVRSTLLRMKLLVKAPKPSPSFKPSIGKILDEKNPPANPFDCEDDFCAICFPQFFPSLVSVSDNEARQIAASLVNSIRQDLAFLRQTLTDHADFIVNKWRKKSSKKRSTFLCEIADLYDKKWAAVHLLDYGHRLEGQRNITAGLLTPPTDRYRDTWFFPYLDSEMLSEDPMLFLSLLHHRTINEPEKWLMFDNENLVLAERISIVTPTFNRHCVVMGGPDTGKLVDWNADQAHRWEIVGFNKAHALLTAQETMMAFLRKCVVGLLDESKEPPKLIHHLKWDHLIETNFSRFDTHFAWSTDSVKPFSNPPSFDPLEIIELIASRHRLVKDDLELLQTDPAYVQEQVREMNSSSLFENVNENTRWRFLIEEIFTNTLLRELYLRQMVVECEKMGERFRTFKESPNKKTQRDYDGALYTVLECCIETFVVFQRHTDVWLLFQRGLKHNFDGKHDKVNRGFTSNDFFPDDMLFWSLSCPGYDEHRPFTLDPALNFAIIDRLCRTDSKEANRIGQHLLDQLSDMAVMNGVICSIRSEHLRDRHLSDHFLKRVSHASFRLEFINKVSAPYDNDSKEIGDRMSIYLEQLCVEHPWPRGKKDEQWLNQATASRQALDKLWQGMRVIWGRKFRGHNVAEPDVVKDLAQMRASQGERHLAELAAEREEISNLEPMRQGAKNKSQPDNKVQSVWGKEHAGSEHLTYRTKTKLRQKPKTENMSHTAVPKNRVRVKRPIEPSLIPVKRDNMSVFTHMYPAQGEVTQRSFAWQHLLDAMADAGFSIIQSQGSAVTLKQEDKGDESVRVKTIVFRRPHPVSTINPVMLHIIAKPMTKWFGWKRGLFIERPSENV